MLIAEHDDTKNNNEKIAESFRQQFLNLVVLSWTGPPIVGFSFLIYIRMFSFEQMVGILTSLLESSFVVGSLVVSVWYFRRYIRPVLDYLKSRHTDLAAPALDCMRKFPLHFWSVFLLYLLIAPTTVILAAEWNTDYIATPIDWFRIHLVALIVSIIVGLPLFFIMLDLFGRAVGALEIEKAHVTVKTKVFMIGALVPLLIDTMLVQYYWTRTGYFSFEAFVVWLMLELLAIGGSIIFVRSFSQSLQPLQSWSDPEYSIKDKDLSQLYPQSTDEFGVLATSYRRVLNDWKVSNEILEINYQIINRSSSAQSIAHIVDHVVELCREVTGESMVFLILETEDESALVGVAHTGVSYKPEGYYRLQKDEASLAVWVYENEQMAVINDAVKDERVSQRMIEKFNIKAAMGVPLQVGGKVFGVLMTVCQQSGRRYSDREIRLLEGMAREVAIAVQATRLQQKKLAAELASRDSEELIRLLMAATEEGIYGIDLDGKCIFINSAGVKMLGYDSEEELLGKNIHELIHHTYPDGTPYPKEQCNVRLSALRGERGHSDEEMHWRKDGTGFYTEYWSHPIMREGKVAGSVVTFFDITERKANEAAMRFQAHHDKLTSLPNRWLLQDRIQQSIAAAERGNRKIALMFIDLNRFKKINDTLGHEFGDEVLLAVADRLKELVRSGDTLARLGGDEFVMLLTSLRTNEEAAEIAERLLSEIKKPFRVRDGEIYLGASIGVASWPEHGHDADSLLKHADFAMYRAKEQGSDSYQFYTAEIHQQVNSRYRMEHELQQAIEKNELRVVYQPQYDLNSGQIIGLEVLCRWYSEEMGEVGVEDFISVAEETGYISALGINVLNIVKDDILQLKQRGINVPRMAVNLSAQQIYSEETIALIKDAVNSGEIEPGMLELEITESSLMSDPERAQQQLTELSNIGVRIAVDDFGTGYSSLAYLKRFSVDMLKIDRSFVRDLADDEDDRAIVNSIIAMARTMGLEVVAEGIENSEQEFYLREHGCHIGQGFLFAKPQPLDEIIARYYQ